MRKSLLDLVEKTIVYKYDLPYVEGSIPRTIFSTVNDKCFCSTNDNAIIEIIYNSIIDYSFNEFEMTDKDFSDLHTIAFQDRIRFDAEDSDETKLKYGFFGEVLLYVILKVYFGTESIISKGYLYNPIENAESKGYDSYHLIEDGTSLQLWFGETKFHQTFTTAINDVLSKINNSLSDNYLSRNLLVLRKNKDNLNQPNSKIKPILDNWTITPIINILEELKKHSIELVYPVVILFGNKKNDYDESIKAIPKYIEEKYTVEEYILSIPYSLFFIFLPMENVKAVKTEVLKWIESKKQLLS
jgi:hypothetical protein